jgi:hypothetical protein
MENDRPNASDCLKNSDSSLLYLDFTALGADLEYSDNKPLGNRRKIFIYFIPNPIRQG